MLPLPQFFTGVFFGCLFYYCASGFELRRILRDVNFDSKWVCGMTPLEDDMSPSTNKKLVAATVIARGGAHVPSIPSQTAISMGFKVPDYICPESYNAPESALPVNGTAWGPGNCDRGQLTQGGWDTLSDNGRFYRQYYEDLLPKSAADLQQGVYARALDVSHVKLSHYAFMEGLLGDLYSTFRDDAMVQVLADDDPMKGQLNACGFESMQYITHVISNLAQSTIFEELVEQATLISKEYEKQVGIPLPIYDRRTQNGFVSLIEMLGLSACPTVNKNGDYSLYWPRQFATKKGLERNSDDKDDIPARVVTWMQNAYFQKIAGNAKFSEFTLGKFVYELAMNFESVIAGNSPTKFFSYMGDSDDPLMSLLGFLGFDPNDYEDLGASRYWPGLGASISMELWQDNDGYYLRPLYLGKSIDIKDLPDTDGFYKWEDVRAYMSEHIPVSCQSSASRRLQEEQTPNDAPDVTEGVPEDVTEEYKSNPANVINEALSKLDKCCPSCASFLDGSQPMPWELPPEKEGRNIKRSSWKKCFSLECAGLTERVSPSFIFTSSQVAYRKCVTDGDFLSSEATTGLISRTLKCAAGEKAANGDSYCDIGQARVTEYYGNAANYYADYVEATSGGENWWLWAVVPICVLMGIMIIIICLLMHADKLDCCAKKYDHDDIDPEEDAYAEAAAAAEAHGVQLTEENKAEFWPAWAKRGEDPPRTLDDVKPKPASPKDVKPEPARAKSPKIDKDAASKPGKPQPARTGSFSFSQRKPDAHSDTSGSMSGGGSLASSSS